jgi:hypothetical protein
MRALPVLAVDIFKRRLVLIWAEKQAGQWSGG